MNIDKYIKWDEIWNNEIFLDVDIDEQPEFEKIINQFQKDDRVSIDTNECCIYNNKEFVFVFSERGGQSESDTQGWSREYYFTFDSDYLLIGAKYEQG